MSVFPLRAKQLTRSKLISNFDLDFTIDKEGRVTVPAAWQSKNLVVINFPIATKLTKRIRVHRKAAPVFMEWFRMWDAEACRCVVSYGGAFVPRLMRLAKNLPITDDPTRGWSSYLSRHSRGVAMDINPKWNRQGGVGAQPGELGDLSPIIRLARQVRVPMKDPRGDDWEAGIVCGVDWSPMSVKDPMHFEIGRF